MRLRILILLFLELGTMAFLAESFAQGASQSHADRCSREVNDDTPRPFEASLRAGFVRAYKRLFPDAQGEPDTAELKTAYFRCMDGKLLACFVGANLPCNKLDTSKTNRGATAFCRQHPNKDTVPMAATGHDTIYFFACSAGHATIKEQNWTIDRRGFGVELWKPIN